MRIYFGSFVNNTRSVKLMIYSGKDSWLIFVEGNLVSQKPPNKQPHRDEEIRRLSQRGPHSTVSCCHVAPRVWDCGFYYVPGLSFYSVPDREVSTTYGGKYNAWNRIDGNWYVRILVTIVADGWAGAVMQKPLAIQKCYGWRDGPTRQGVESRDRD